MRIPQVRTFEIFRTVNREGERGFGVRLTTQPAHRWLAARIYHWYDMWVFKLPGFGLLESIKKWRFRNRPAETYLPISAEQDLRCYHLAQRGKTELATLTIDEQTFNQLRAGD